MTISNQHDDKKNEIPACACGSSGLSNYANAEIKAIAEHPRLDKDNMSLLSRHASATNNMRRLRELEAAPVVDLTTYRAILRYFGFCR